MATSIPSLLVTGASGHLGSRVLEVLVERGACRVVGASRTPERIAHLSERGVDIRAADFDAPETLDAAFAGIDKLLIVSTDQLTVPGQRRRQHQAALDAAVRAGVSHVCYTSMPAPDVASPITFAADHVAMEQALRDSGLGYTVLRNSWYAEDLLFLLPHVLRTGTWYTSAGDGRIAFVAREDTAQAAASALQRSFGHTVHEITGPQALTIEEIATIAERVFELSIDVVPVSDQELAAKLAEQGVPGFYVPMAVMTDANQREGRFEVVTTAVLDLVGRPPEGLESFLSRNKAAFAPRQA